MSTINRDQLVANLASDLIDQVAHEELYLFQDTSEAYFKNRDKMLKRETGKNEPLAIGDVVGIGTAILMSPIVLKIVDVAITAIAEEVKEIGVIKKLLKKIGLVKEKEKKVTLPLAPEQLKQVYAAALEAARQSNLPEPKARQVVDSLITNLALASK